jgi:hypothetical protein
MHLTIIQNVDSTYVLNLWSIHDYLAYGKYSDWCIHDRLNCQICMDDYGAFRLEHSRKVIFFYCHRRFLPLSHAFSYDKVKAQSRYRENAR